MSFIKNDLSDSEINIQGTILTLCIMGLNEKEVNSWLIEVSIIEPCMGFVYIGFWQSNHI